MNERIQKLAKQAGLEGENGHYEYDFFDPQKFAELIVAECVKVSMRSVSDDEPKEAWYLIQEHFGVE